MGGDERVREWKAIERAWVEMNASGKRLNACGLRRTRKLTRVERGQRAWVETNMSGKRSNTRVVETNAYAIAQVDRGRRTWVETNASGKRSNRRG